jgi:hypothetical protein
MVTIFKYYEVSININRDSSSTDLFFSCSQSPFRFLANPQLHGLAALVLSLDQDRVQRKIGGNVMRIAAGF